MRTNVLPQPAPAERAIDTARVVDRGLLFRRVGPLVAHGGARFQIFCFSSVTDLTWATRHTVL